MGVDEAAVWAAACAGDERAFSSLFHLHYDRVFRHVVGLAEQRVDADEVTAAAFLILWESRARVRLVSGSVLPWLLVTAGHAARNHGRLSARYRRLLARLPRDDEAVDAAVVVEERSEQDQRTASMAAAIRALKPLDAQLIALTVSAGLSVVDAAAAVGISAGAARVRLHRARAKLRQRLGSEMDLSPVGEEA